MLIILGVNFHLTHFITSLVLVDGVSLSPPMTAPHQALRIEHEYKRKGAWAYLAAWDVRRAKIFGRLEEKSGIAPFEKLVSRVLSKVAVCTMRA